MPHSRRTAVCTHALSEAEALHSSATYWGKGVPSRLVESATSEMLCLHPQHALEGQAAAHASWHVDDCSSVQDGPRRSPKGVKGDAPRVGLGAQQGKPGSGHLGERAACAVTGHQHPAHPVPEVACRGRGVRKKIGALPVRDALVGANWVVKRLLAPGTCTCACGRR